MDAQSLEAGIIRVEQLAQLDAAADDEPRGRQDQSEIVELRADGTKKAFELPELWAFVRIR